MAEVLDVTTTQEVLLAEVAAPVTVVGQPQPAPEVVLDRARHLGVVILVDVPQAPTVTGQVGAP